MDVVIVESPAKAKTINKYLGKNFEVYASYGHIRDLPSKDGSVDPDADFSMIWDVDTKSAKRMSDIARAVKGADRLILATDPDREGEAISWHVLEVLKAKKVLKDTTVQRVAFNAITKTAILEAMANPREIDAGLVDAYLARRALDYLVGFTLSPVLWRKLPGARSAGRVQSVTLRLICERELEIEKFVKREYWSLQAALKTGAGAPFVARLVGADGEKLGRLDVANAERAHALRDALDKAAFSVAKVEAKPARRNPAPPFTTSTMQQEASRKLGFAPSKTMQLAQRLYEGVDVGGETVGIITYMRTDGVDMAPEAVTAARAVIAKEFGERYVPKAPRKYTVKAKNAQEAHEAVRPTDMARLPKQIARTVEGDLARLYDLIWTRTVASQMESAELERTTVDILAQSGGRALDLRANGQVVRFDGFLRLYQEGRDDLADGGDDEDGGRLPPMAARDRLAKDRIDADQHFTEPPPRFTEATIIKRMEELGIGRPSTYDATVQTLKAREYVRLDKKRLIPEDKGRLVIAFLESFFARYVGYDFTADLEEKLDRISNSEIDWRQVLRDFWQDFSAAVAGTKDLRTTEVLDNLNEVLGPHIFPVREDASDPRSCTVCGTGRLSLKLGKFGAFIGCSNYPECKFTRQLNTGGEGGEAAEQTGTKVLGLDAASGLEVTLRDGRFGPYIQLGEGEKPKRSSLPKGLAPADVTLEQATALLSLPREVARHPETKEPILAALGRYGPYVQHGKTYANLGPEDDVLTIGGNRAIDLVVAKESGLTGRRFGAEATPGKVLGDHPDGGPVTLKAGRYGPYVQHGKVNATLPKEADPTTLTLEAAIALLTARASAGGGPVQGRLLGEHPSGGPITVRQGRFGPYVNHGKTNATLTRDMSPESLTLEEAIRLVEDREGAGPKKKAPAKAAKAAPAKTAARAAKPAAKSKSAPKKAPAKSTAKKVRSA